MNVLAAPGGLVYKPRSQAIPKERTHPMKRRFYVGNALKGSDWKLAVLEARNPTHRASLAAQGIHVYRSFAAAESRVNRETNLINSLS